MPLLHRVKPVGHRGEEDDSSADRAERGDDDGARFAAVAQQEFGRDVSGEAVAEEWRDQRARTVWFEEEAIGGSLCSG
jgi:hypothetical protein